MTNLTKQRYIVRLHLKDREIATWILDDRPLAIGRTPENDIVIDNLSVSRQHARIEVGAEGPVIRDHSSTNGLMIDGRPVNEAAIESGMTIQIGKHILSFEAEAANTPASGASTANAYEPTIQRTSTHRLPNPAKLTESHTDGDREYLIDTAVFLSRRTNIGSRTSLAAARSRSMARRFPSACFRTATQSRSPVAASCSGCPSERRIPDA